MEEQVDVLKVHVKRPREYYHQQQQHPLKLIH